MGTVNPLGDKIMSGKENSTFGQNSNAKTNSTPNIVRTSQMFIPNQPNYATDSYELPARYKK